MLDLFIKLARFETNCWRHSDNKVANNWSLNSGINIYQILFKYFNYFFQNGLIFKSKFEKRCYNKVTSQCTWTHNSFSVIHQTQECRTFFILIVAEFSHTSPIIQSQLFLEKTLMFAYLVSRIRLSWLTKLGRFPTLS